MSSRSGVAAWAAGIGSGRDPTGAAANRRAPRLYPSRRAAGGTPPSSKIAPMRILALDTSTEWCSVAVGEGAPGCERAEHAGQCALGAAAADGRRGAGRRAVDGWLTSTASRSAAAPDRSPAFASAARWRRVSGSRSIARVLGVPTLEAIAAGGWRRRCPALPRRADAGGLRRRLSPVRWKTAAGRPAGGAGAGWRRAPGRGVPAGRLDRRRKRLRGLPGPRRAARPRACAPRSAARRRRPSRCWRCRAWLPAMGCRRPRRCRCTSAIALR